MNAFYIADKNELLTLLTSLLRVFLARHLGIRLPIRASDETVGNNLFNATAVPHTGNC